MAGGTSLNVGRKRDLGERTLQKKGGAKPESGWTGRRKEGLRAPTKNAAGVDETSLVSGNIRKPSISGRVKKSVRPIGFRLK